MPAAAPALRFANFELQPQERRLLADGRDAGLGGRALDVLIVLAQRAAVGSRAQFSFTRAGRTR